MRWTPKQASSRLFVALDGISNKLELHQILHELKPLGLRFKIRPALIYRFGTEFLREVGLHGPSLFVDAKLGDIGNSSAEDLETLIAELDPGYVTCHVGGSASENMLRVLDVTARKHPDNATLIGVTILTDITSAECERIYGQGNTPEVMVLHFVERGLQEGNIGHTVCSPQEAKTVREKYPAQIIFCPGVRPAGTSQNDQKRTATIAEAVAAGVDHLIIGRPIIQADNRMRAARDILNEIAAATAA
jgi:orotidine-5'-phosphate decarboxylase